LLFIFYEIESGIPKNVLFIVLVSCKKVKINGIKTPARRIDMENHGDVIEALKVAALRAPSRFTGGFNMSKPEPGGNATHVKNHKVGKLEKSYLNSPSK